MFRVLVCTLLLLGLVDTGLCCLPFAAIGKKIKSVIIPEVKIGKVVTQGCFIARDPKANEDTAGSVNTITDITWQKCRDLCFGSRRPGNKGKIGMKHITCWCNFEYRKVDQTEDSKCDQKCAGNDREVCGGQDYISVYLPNLDGNG